MKISNKSGMHALIASLFAASLAFTAAPLFAEDAHHPEKIADSAASVSASVQKLQANTKKMQTQLDHIAQAKTDEERQTAMAEHMRTMQESMQMTQAMHHDSGACAMMGEGMGGGMMGMGGGGMGMKGGMGAGGGMGMGAGMKGCACGGMKGGMMSGNQPGAVTPERMEMMEKRMDKMQKMMEQQRGSQPAVK